MPSGPTFIIDCAQNFVPNVDILKQTDETGEYVPTDVSGISFVLAVLRGSNTPIHATLQQNALARSGKTGRIYAVFGVADLQTHLLPLHTAGTRVVWLNMFKSGVYAGEAFECYVQRDRLRP